MDATLRARLDAARTSGDVEALVELGCVLSDDDEHIDAAWCFQQAVAAGGAWAAFNLANELVALGRDHDALAAYEQAIVADETDAWLNMGDVLERLGDLAGALRAYEQGQAAGDVNAGLRRAFLLREIGDRPAAEAAVAALAGLGSPVADAIGACWQWDRTLDLALEARLRAGAELFAATRADLADLLLITDRVDEAEQVLNRGVSLGETESFIPLGNLYLDVLNRPVAAEQTFRAGIAAGDLWCHHNLASLLEDQDRMPEALDHYRLGARYGDTLAQQALDRLDAEDAEGDQQ